MRFLMLALMILMLPLRGWVGDAMATGVAAAQVSGLQAGQKKVLANATENIATHAHETGATTHFHSTNFDFQTFVGSGLFATAQAANDCGPMHAALSDGQQSAGSSDDNTADCGACPSCQACHTVALTLAADKAITTFNPVAQPVATAQIFASADAALSEKPPIS